MLSQLISNDFEPGGGYATKKSLVTGETADGVRRPVLSLIKMMMVTMTLW